MPYNPTYSKPTWSTEEQVKSTKLNQMVDNTEHNYKYKPELGPDAPAGVKMATGKKTVTLPASSSGPVAFTVTFATDSLYGDPAFTQPPVVTASIKQITSGTILDVTIVLYAVTGTQFTLYIIPYTVPSADTNYEIHFIAVGA